MNSDDVAREVIQSACFQSESAWLERGGCKVARRPGLYKLLENERVRLIFPTDARRIEEGTAVGLVCLFDLAARTNVYAHAVFAGPSVNASLHSLFVPPNQSRPQPGIEGYKAIQQFEAWKRAAWVKFLNEELEVGPEQASKTWIANFWKALDRMYGGGNLLENVIR